MSHDRKRDDANEQRPARPGEQPGKELRSPEGDPRKEVRQDRSAPDERACDDPSRAPESGSP